MTFLEHLQELRQRILVIVAAVGISFVLLYAFFDRKLVEFFMLPMSKAIAGKGKFQFTSPAEGFIFDLKISFIAALFVSAPLIFYELWKFVAPALYRNEKKLLLPFILFSTILFAGGAAFGYFIVFPYAFQFFATFSYSGVEVNPKLSDYFTFATRMLLAFGLVFEFPLVAVFAARIGLIDAGFLNRNRKYALVLIFTAAAVLTPGPDVISQLLLAFPLWFLYELSLGLVWFFQRRDAKSQDMAG
jgi:sec-independent protein translocase protein TatC